MASDKHIISVFLSLSLSLSRARALSKDKRPASLASCDASSSCLPLLTPASMSLWSFRWPPVCVCVLHHVCMCGYYTRQTRYLFSIKVYNNILLHKHTTTHELHNTILYMQTKLCVCVCVCVLCKAAQPSKQRAHLHNL